MLLRRSPAPLLTALLVFVAVGGNTLAQDATPSTEANKDVVRQFLDAFAAPDTATLDQVVAPDLVFHAAPPGLPPTREGLVQVALAFEAGIPDYRVTVEDQVAEGDLVATRATVSGTQTGAFFGIPPTGRSFAAAAIFVDRVVGSRVVEHWDMLDQLSILTQLGVIPGAAPAPPATPAAGTPAAVATPMGAIDLEANKAVALRFLEAFDTGDPAILDEVLAPDFVYRSAGPGEPTDAEGYKQIVAAFGAFPDGRSTAEAVLAEGDRVVIRWTFTGTHQGEFFGIPPTGRQVTVQGIDWYRLEGGRIVELWDVIDEVGLLTQLGVLPAPGATPTAATPGP